MKCCKALVLQLEWEQQKKILTMLLQFIQHLLRSLSQCANQYNQVIYRVHHLMPINFSQILKRRDFYFDILKYNNSFLSNRPKPTLVNNYGDITNYDWSDKWIMMRYLRLKWYVNYDALLNELRWMTVIKSFLYAFWNCIILSNPIHIWSIFL